MKKNLRILFAFFFFVPFLLTAQTEFSSPPDSITEKFTLGENFLTDSVIFSWKDLNDTSLYYTLPLIVKQDSVPVVPNELVMDRLTCLQNTIPLHYNQYVQAFVNYFTIRNRKYTRRLLEREHVYFPLFEKYLEKHTLPQELKYLAVVESALNPKAVSWAKAVGLWQFMSPTAGDFRLKINEYVDERMDPEKSTEAACKFLKQLYRIFGDWELALAAYNCGPGNVKKAIARAGGGKKTFWQVFPYLPKETRSYVPTFTAIIYAMNHPLDHDLRPDTVLYAIATDTLLINQSLDLNKLSVQLQLAPDELSKLNPAIRKGYLPETIRKYPLIIPAQTRETFAYNRAALLDSCRVPKFKKPVAPVAPVMVAAVADKKDPETQTPETKTDSLQKTEYVVVKNDNLYKIAEKHQVTAGEIKDWNNLRKSTLYAGQKLLIYQLPPDSTASEEQAIATVENQKTANPVAIKSASLRPARKKAMEAVKLIHAVQPGDTLWNISRKYNNIPVDQIRKLNKLKSDDIKPGQKLILS